MPAGTHALTSTDLLRSGSFPLTATRGCKDPEQLLNLGGAQAVGVRAVPGDLAQKAFAAPWGKGQQALKSPRAADKHPRIRVSVDICPAKLTLGWQFQKTPRNILREFFAPPQFCIPES